MSNTTPTQYTRVHRGARLPHGPATTPQIAIEHPGLPPFEAVRDAVMRHDQPQGWVEEAYAEQMVSLWWVIEKGNRGFDIDVILDQHHAGTRRLSRAEFTSAMRESDDRDRVVDEACQDLVRVMRRFDSYRKFRLKRSRGTGGRRTFEVL